jgi:hypothetical protein
MKEGRYLESNYNKKILIIFQIQFDVVRRDKFSTINILYFMILKVQTKKRKSEI